jgi:hypothetical protein
MKTHHPDGEENYKITNEAKNFTICILKNPLLEIK